MVSADPEADPEKVAFSNPVSTDGPVESWLLRIEEEMRETLYK